MTKYIVPITISISGHVSVDADNPEEAIRKAREKYYKNKRNYSHSLPKAMEVPCVDTDWADEEDVEIEEEQDAE